MLALQEAGEELHLEALRDAVRSYPPKPRLLPLLLTHPFPCALVFTDPLVRLVPE